MVKILKDGDLVYDLPNLEEIRHQRKRDLARLDPGIRRLVNPHIFHVSLTESLWELKARLIRQAGQQMKVT